MSELGPTPAQDESHQRMLGLLRDLAYRAPYENPYHGRRKVSSLREQLARQPGSPPPSLQLETASEELNLGNIEAAIELYTEALNAAKREGTDPGIIEQANYSLGVAYLRLGETQNCCEANTPQSCILPIRGDGIHLREEGSRQAIQHLLEVLDGSPESQSLHDRALWLLNLAYMTLGDFPDGVPPRYRVPAEQFQPEFDFPRFQNVAKQLDLDTFNLSGGAITDDFDNDEYLDIITSSWDNSGQIRFFRNNRDGTFVERTHESGLTGLLGGLNLKQADYDNDGNLDFLVLRGAWMYEDGRHPNSLIRNNGNGTFTDVTFAAGLGEVHYPTQTAEWADYDNDGDLDLYIGNESSSETDFPCQLFENQGDGTFHDVAARAGVQNDRYVKGVTWGDFDNDRWPDLYVSNLGGRNRLYRNRGDGTFVDVAKESDVSEPLESFPTWFWDFNNDGALDLYVSSYSAGTSKYSQYIRDDSIEFASPRLYQGDGTGRFKDVASACGLNYPAIPMGSNFGDLENDGFLDFYLGTGSPAIDALVPNVLFLNRDGQKFTNATVASGLGHLQKGHAISFADLDQDGDLDVFAQMGGAYKGDEAHNCLYENPGFGNHWITIEAVGTTTNKSAIGARIKVTCRVEQESRSVYRHVNSGSSFGANPLRQTIGLGAAQEVDEIEIFWPTTGKKQILTGVAADQSIQVVEGVAGYQSIRTKSASLRNK